MGIVFVKLGSLYLHKVSSFISSIGYINFFKDITLQLLKRCPCSAYTIDYRCDDEKETLELGRHFGIIA
jgi:hypothetical protein